MKQAVCFRSICLSRGTAQRFGLLPLLFRSVNNKAQIPVIVRSVAANPSEVSKPDAVAKARRSKKAAIPEWELETVRELSDELKHARFKFSDNMNKKAAQSQLIRYAVNEDYSSLIAYVMQFVEAIGRNSTQYRGDDQFFAISLLLSARGMRHYARDTVSADSAEAVSLFYSVSSLLERMPVLGGNTRTAWIILMERLEKWADIRSIDQRSSDIDRILIDLQRRITAKVRGWVLKENRLLFSDKDRAVVSQRMLDMNGTNIDDSRVVGEDYGYDKALLSLQHNYTSQLNIRFDTLQRRCTSLHIFVVSEDYGYDKDLRIVDELRTVADESEYLGSPYSSINITKEGYMARFAEQLTLETTHCLRVRNFCRISSEIPAEQLIDSWRWKEAIENTLKIHIAELRQFPLKGYLSVLDISEMASLVMTSVLTMCAQGQHLISYPVFEFALAAPVLEVLHRKFVSKIVDNRQQLSEELFSEYIRYVLEPSLSRRYTLREWWMECCNRARVDSRLELPFHDFHAEIRKQLGSFLINAVIEACTFPVTTKEHSPSVKEQRARAFGIRNVVIEEGDSMTEENKVNLSKMVALNMRMIDLLDVHQFEYLLFPTLNLPMKVPPRPWIDYGDGGPAYTKSSDVLRNLPDYPRTNISVEVRRRLRKRSQARPVFDALNDLGSTPWKINSTMLDILIEVFKMSSDPSKADILHRLSVPLRSDTVQVPDFVKTFGDNVHVDDIPAEQWRAYSKSKFEAVKKRNELNSLWYWLMYRLVMAEHYRQDVLFFPHNMDFRGRVYPISPYLSHMGDDINRSLLRFAQGKRLGEDGLRWLKLHCINLTGHLKRESINSRFQFFDKVLPKIIDSAENPINGEKWWMDSDEPWQTLAACIEIRDALNSEDPTAFISHLPIHQDGSCNGLQHYAALGRDHQGGSEVNLLPNPLPADVYSSVAKRVEAKRVEDENSSDPNVRELAIALRAALPDQVPRKVIKQTVMTTVYGVTMYGATQQIKRQLKALEIDSDQLGRFSSYLAHKTFASLHDAFTSSMQLKDWFRYCAKSIVGLMKPVEWITPLGLPVMQPYLKLSKKHNRLCLLPVMMKQMNAFPPNFVHSLDSTHMMLTSLHCRRVGMTFAAVHDCYWTHACHVDSMNILCREQFIHLHQQPLIQQCSKFFIEKYLPNRRRRAMGAEEVKRLEAIFQPSVKAGDLDIQHVRESIYFFS